jgi:hypothetical protein
MKSYLKFSVIFISLIVGIAGCKATSPSDNPTIASKSIDSKNPTTSKSIDSPTYVSRGEAYETTYALCAAECAEKPSKLSSVTPKKPSIDKVITWGRPTEIGIIYLKYNSQYLPLVPLAKMPYNHVLLEQTRNQLVVKSQGVLPPLSKPLATEKFTPIGAFFPPPMFESDRRRASLKPQSELEYKDSVKTGNIQIISIKKIDLLTEKAQVKASEIEPDPSTIGAMEELEQKRYEPYRSYYKFYENKPDIKPQQVNKITWQEGQPPQVISVKKW